MAETVFIALGANLGNPETTVHAAVKDLQSIAVGEVRQSSLWRSAATEMAQGTPDFCNAVVKFETALDPELLLQFLQQLEINNGRQANHGYHESRTLDLDIIAYGQQVIDSPALTIPHPSAAQRLFVLLPLQELDAGFRFANLDDNLQQLIDQAPQLEIEMW